MQELDARCCGNGKAAPPAAGLGGPALQVVGPRRCHRCRRCATGASGRGATGAAASRGAAPGSVACRPRRLIPGRLPATSTAASRVSTDAAAGSTSPAVPLWPPPALPAVAPPLPVVPAPPPGAAAVPAVPAEPAGPLPLSRSRRRYRPCPRFRPACTPAPATAAGAASEGEARKKKTKTNQSNDEQAGGGKPACTPVRTDSLPAPRIDVTDEDGDVQHSMSWRPTPDPTETPVPEPVEPEVEAILQRRAMGFRRVRGAAPLARIAPPHGRAVGVSSTTSADGPRARKRPGRAPAPAHQPRDRDLPVHRRDGPP